MKLASVIPKDTKTFQTLLPEIKMILNGAELTEKEFLNAFHSLRYDASQGFEELHANVIKFVYNETNAPLMHVFRNSMNNDSFPEKS